MIQLWNNEPVQWRVELEAQKGEPLSLRTGEQGRVLIVNLGEEPKPETVRRAAAKAVKTDQSLGGHSVMLDAPTAAKAQAMAGVSA
ncbi:MAG: hypothetical protein K2M15_06080, partial [Oscillospiraceae bacterium]|nr:hypothetical protein [Oscillospiraceae bacterium]